MKEGEFTGILFAALTTARTSIPWLNSVLVLLRKLYRKVLPRSYFRVFMHTYASTIMAKTIHWNRLFSSYASEFGGALPIIDRQRLNSFLDRRCCRRYSPCQT